MPLSKQEEYILQSIVIASENNPGRPEFPSDNPKFPATPTYQIDVPGFANVWLKDESVNLTGTHKDRMAWEIVVSYHGFLLSKKRGQIDGPLPHMSIISSGSAAIAIQSALRRYSLPHLKVLVDNNTNPDITALLRQLGCEVYQTDLSKAPLNWKEILQLTNNPDGFDITSNQALAPTDRFYDWLSYEIINSSPDYCFIPFGTGNLYENILNINKREVFTGNHDPRFQGDSAVLRKCNFMGATTANPDSQADKLYAPHLPFSHYDEQWMRFYKYAGFCGTASNIYVIQEEYLDQAMALAQKQGINCEPSGIAGLALMLQMQGHLPKDKKMLIVNTGNSSKLVAPARLWQKKSSFSIPRSV